MLVISELGTPKVSEQENGKRTDLYMFKQGYSSGTKVSRAFFHGAADVLTLGLWEVVGTPVESYASGTEMTVQVVYDAQDQIEGYRILKGSAEPGRNHEPVGEAY